MRRNDGQARVDADRLNRMQIREQEQLNRERRRQDESAAASRAALMQNTKQRYSHVPSHGYGRPTPGTPPKQDRRSGQSAANDGEDEDEVEIRVFIRECDGEHAEQHCYPERQGSGAPAARAPPRAGPAPGPRPEPHARLSALNEGGARACAGVNNSNNNEKAAGLGKVPRYLQQRKAELQAEKQAMHDALEQEKERAKIPPGCRLVPEAEKAEMLQRLEARRNELELQLNKLPIRFDTQAIKTRRHNIEEELREIETAVLKYNTKKPLFLPVE